MNLLQKQEYNKIAEKISEMMCQVEILQENLEENEAINLNDINELSKLYYTLELARGILDKICE